MWTYGYCHSESVALDAKMRVAALGWEIDVYRCTVCCKEMSWNKTPPLVWRLVAMIRGACAACMCGVEGRS